LPGKELSNHERKEVGGWVKEEGFVKIV